MADLNLQLLPEHRTKIDVHIPGENRYINTAVAFLVLTLAVYGGTLYYKNSLASSIQETDNQISALENSRDKATEEKLITLGKRLQVTGTLLNDHLFWSSAFAFIQSLVQPQVEFKNLSGNLGEKKFVFKAEAASYDVVARQIASFRTKDQITDLTLEKVNSLPNGRIEFNMSIHFNPERLLKKPAGN